MCAFESYRCPRRKRVAIGRHHLDTLCLFALLSTSLRISVSVLAGTWITPRVFFPPAPSFSFFLLPACGVVDLPFGIVLLRYSVVARACLDLDSRRRVPSPCVRRVVAILVVVYFNL